MAFLLNDKELSGLTPDDLQKRGSRLSWFACKMGKSLDGQSPITI